MQGFTDSEKDRGPKSNATFRAFISGTRHVLVELCLLDFEPVHVLGVRPLVESLASGEAARSPSLSQLYTYMPSKLKKSLSLSHYTCIYIYEPDTFRVYITTVCYLQYIMESKM